MTKAARCPTVGEPVTGDAEPPTGRPATSSHPRTQLLDVARRRPAWRGLPAGTATAGGGRPAAVLILFGVLDDRPAHRHARAVPSDLDVLLVGRATSLTHHPGQVSFPGGRIDPADTGPAAAAVREAVEETGLDPAGVEVLGVLDDLPLPVSNHRVTPVLAWWAQPSAVEVVDHGESAAVFRVPVADLLDPANRRTCVLQQSRTITRTPAFLLRRPVPDRPGDDRAEVVWGFTALVLDRLFDELGWTEVWDRTTTVPAPL